MIIDLVDIYQNTDLILSLWWDFDLLQFRASIWMGSLIRLICQKHISLFKILLLPSITNSIKLPSFLELRNAPVTWKYHTWLPSHTEKNKNVSLVFKWLGEQLNREMKVWIIYMEYYPKLFNVYSCLQNHLTINESYRLFCNLNQD